MILEDSRPGSFDRAGEVEAGLVELRHPDPSVPAGRCQPSAVRGDGKARQRTGMASVSPYESGIGRDLLTLRLALTIICAVSPTPWLSIGFSLFSTVASVPCSFGHPN